MKKGSFFKIASLGMLTLFSTFFSLSVVAEEVAADYSNSEITVVDDSATEDTPVCTDENGVEVLCELEDAATSEELTTTDDATTEETSMCVDENGMEVPCEFEDASNPELTTVDDATTEEAPVCLDENDIEVPCE